MHASKKVSSAMLPAPSAFFEWQGLCMSRSSQCSTVQPILPETGVFPLNNPGRLQSVLIIIACHNGMIWFLWFL